DVQPVKEILAERSVGDGLRDVTVRRGDQPNVDLEVARVADATDLALLDRAQELDLDRRRDLGDLVEEERPAGRRREEPDRVGHRSREGAFRVAKEIGRASCRERVLPTV